MTAHAAMIPRKIPGALRIPKIATIATKKTEGIMKVEEITLPPLPLQGKAQSRQGSLLHPPS